MVMLRNPLVAESTNASRHRLSTGANEKIQLTALLAAFKNTVELSAKSG